MHIVLLELFAGGVVVVAVRTTRRFPSPRICAERANASNVVNPLVCYQGNNNGSQLVFALDEARRRAILLWPELSGAIPCRPTKEKSCEGLRHGAPAHVALARKLNLSLPAVFYRWHECEEPPKSSSSSTSCCEDVSRGSLGNTLGYYWVARAAAKAAGASFILLRDLHACPDQIISWLPAVAVPTTRKTSYADAASVMCAGRDHFIHLSNAWLPALPEASAEIRAALRAWAEGRFSDFDDVAVHLRCGDTLAQLHAQYGLLPFGAIAELVPADKNVTIGIVTQPYDHYCRRNAPSPAETATAHGAFMCSCQCDHIVRTLKKTLARLRPRARIRIHSNDKLIASWARLALAPTATICQPSTFCLWPTLAATRGFLTKGTLFPTADRIAAALPNVTVIHKPPYVSYARLGSRKSTVRGACGTSMADIKSRVSHMLVPKAIAPLRT